MKFDIKWLKEQPSWKDLSYIPIRLTKEALILIKENAMRECRICHKKKPKECFYKSSSYSTGYVKQCKSCAKVYAIKRRKLVKKLDDRK